MSTSFKPRTVVQAIEDAAKSTQTGYRFIDEDSQAEPFFSHAGIERASARFGGALQSLGLKKGDRVALILPDNSDFVFAFLGALRAGIVPVPIYPPTGLGQLSGYLENTLHIVAKSGAKVLVTSPEIRRVLGTVQSRAPELTSVRDAAISEKSELMLEFADKWLEKRTILWEEAVAALAWFDEHPDKALAVRAQTNAGLRAKKLDEYEAELLKEPTSLSEVGAV